MVGVLSSYMCCGSQQAPISAVLWNPPCRGVQEGRTVCCPQDPRSTHQLLLLESFLCWILSWFLGEMTLNPVSMNLGFYLENGNVLFHRASCPCSSERCNDWLRWIFYLRKMYLTCFWDVVGGMEVLYQRDESKLSMQIGSRGCPFGLQRDLKRDLTHSVCFHLLSANV